MWSLQDVEENFEKIVSAAEMGTPQEVRCDAQSTVVVMSADDYQRLLASAISKRGRFADHLLAFPKA